MRRILAIGGAVALLATTGIGAAGTAFADGDPHFFRQLKDQVMQPGVSAERLFWGGNGDGTYVYALSKEELTDPSWAAGGVPDGMSVERNGCAPAAGVEGVFLCEKAPGEYTAPSPGVTSQSSAAHNTTLHFGIAFAPAGSDVSAAVTEAQTAGSLPPAASHVASRVTLKRAEEVAKNTIGLSSPTLPAGGTATHSVTLHALDAGKLHVSWWPVKGQRLWDRNEWKPEVTSISDGSTATCRQPGPDDYVQEMHPVLECDVTPGDVTISYTLKADAGLAAWKVGVKSRYDVYTPVSTVASPSAKSGFQVESSKPVMDRYGLFAWSGRYLSGWTRSPYSPDPFRGYHEVSGYWAYDTITKLSPVTGYGRAGALVARDKNGSLHYYAPQVKDWEWQYEDDFTNPILPWAFKRSTKTDSGWGKFNVIEGVGDVSGDKKDDLVAREKDTLYLYKGTGNPDAPFAARTKIGTGWGKLNALKGGADLTGDGRADLIARDAGGVLYLYKGTGNAASPFAARTKIGSGWGQYKDIVVTGDTNDDGRTELVARDKANKTYLYKGTGKAAAPFAARKVITRVEGTKLF
ncbi:FG-GAP repeat domain-containing protein [Streptomyces agglomeratus]|uniref:FG-GAP repeat domain-containing protein n=1 Tax=Streptomyces agglomeratus TaxID=285458 RepID=UPI00159F3368|nr:VCBS repeat-containing protein [Streptomyces agglomeratus]